ncbi:hybrid sensor histidine kinase/response regulator [Merismopedia glauca]|uniref:histidine kinase n=1 Tax=Merismopedia glauca CCAP 1448/3 TaxID=1296344 RepID=A0A2T1C5Q6_9CYAN|nr:response regulator [Merismopedia glauca]PSB03564.1 hybrid sensor histidine kinase/response regulator [Merismopedia glauca CCAP 1448/3]
MEPEQQQRIMAYFIEEAKEHLNTIEQGLLNLANTVQNSEAMNELFRAAHSIKGGAAMLGLTKVQKTAHKLEDCFKVLKESPIKPDQKLESLFFMVFDALQTFLEQIQMPAADAAMMTISGVEPIFGELNEYLQKLVTEANPLESAQKQKIQAAFAEQIHEQLRRMLELFKKPDGPHTRQRLRQSCDRLMNLGMESHLSKWQELIATAATAISQYSNSLPTLAQAIITDIKQAQKLLLSGKEAQIKVSKSLLSLAQKGQGSSHLEGDSIIPTGLEIGTNELNSLSELFDGKNNDRNEAWQESDLAFDLEVSDRENQDKTLLDAQETSTDDFDLTSFLEQIDTTTQTSNVDPKIDSTTELNSNESTLLEDAFLNFEPIDATVIDKSPSQLEVSDNESTLLEDAFLNFEPIDATVIDRPSHSNSTRRSSPSVDELEAIEQWLIQMSTHGAGNWWDELEALLNESSSSTAEATEVDELAMLLASDLSTSAAKDANNDFADLESLLQKADQNLGGSPTSVSGSGHPSPRPRVKVFEQTMRVPVKQLDGLSNLVGELVVNRNSLEQEQERIRQSLDNLLYQIQQLSFLGGRMQDLYERSLLEMALNANRQNRQSLSASNFASHNDSDAEDYDPLEMDRFTKFHLISQEMIERIVRVRESASDIEYVVDENDNVARRLRQVTSQLQEGLTRSRMVPFAQAVNRLQRGVRDNALKNGKQVQLVVEGRETLIDKVLLEHLSDPLNHILNNAIAHGLETPAARQAAGKAPIGKVTINANYQGNQTLITISDDGAGINIDTVKAKALKIGLIDAEQAKEMSKLDVYDLLFHPGFSTKDQADELAGRGVGLDVVRTSLTEIRGNVTVESSLGKGTTFTIRLPLTLTICKALCCVSEKTSIAFSMDGVEDTLNLSPSIVQTNAEGEKCVPWRDTLLPFRPLSELLKYNRQISRGSLYGITKEDDSISIVVIRSGSTYIGLQVDRVLGEQEIVIKQLSAPVPKPLGIAGATVLGDGRVMPIADVLELIDLFRGEVRKEYTNLWSNRTTTPVIQEDKHEALVLIVDDSITVRELLSMTFNKAGYRVEQARDGQEAWDKLRSGLPCDLIFCDIEMPRMDGLELLSRIQKDETLNHLPVGMLTSRGADRHRQIAADLGAKGYFTKPYLEEALLEAAQRMMKGEVLLQTSAQP